ncbi:F0F1 ATP synthase subunit gamma [Haliangium sp.]|uniref:F0F1 ATP synthase subunit gamma n=1 Tax=Haliangium sp. TaxID=2663208 RepID=UPI003D112229
MLADSGDLRVIERRIGAVTAVRQVLQAVWALARAQLPLVEAAAAEATQYLDWVDQVVDRLLGAPVARPTGVVLHLVLGPERAYCGALPRQIVEALSRDLPARDRVGLVGRRLIEQAEGAPALAGRVSFGLPGAATHDELEARAYEVAEALLGHAVDAQIELHHPLHDRPGLHRTVLLAGERRLVSYPPETYSPRDEIARLALRESITGRLVVGLAETLRAEVRARIAAADKARGAADRKLDTLRQAWRAARQDQITSELIEVVAGRQAALGARRA